MAYNNPNRLYIAYSNDLFLKSIIESPLCACNSGEVEKAHTFFFICHLYNNIMAKLRQSITQYCNMTLNVHLHGDGILSANSNSVICEAV